MSVWHEIGVDPGDCQKLIHKFGMTFRRLRYPGHFTSEPRAHLTPRIGYRLGPLEHSWIGHQAQKRDQADPGETDALSCWSSNHALDRCYAKIWTCE